MSAFAQIIVIQGDLWISNLFNTDVSFFTLIFDVTPLILIDWLLIIALTSSIILFEEIFKFYHRQKKLE